MVLLGGSYTQAQPYLVTKFNNPQIRIKGKPISQGLQFSGEEQIQWNNKKTDCFYAIDLGKKRKKQQPFPAPDFDVRKVQTVNSYVSMKKLSTMGQSDLYVIDSLEMETSHLVSDSVRFVAEWQNGSQRQKAILPMEDECYYISLTAIYGKIKPFPIDIFIYIEDIKGKDERIPYEQYHLIPLPNTDVHENIEL